MKLMSEILTKKTSAFQNRSPASKIEALRRHFGKEKDGEINRAGKVSIVALSPNRWHKVFSTLYASKHRSEIQMQPEGSELVRKREDEEPPSKNDRIFNIQGFCVKKCL